MTEIAPTRRKEGIELTFADGFLIDFLWRCQLAEFSRSEGFFDDLWNITDREDPRLHLRPPAFKADAQSPILLATIRRNAIVSENDLRIGCLYLGFAE